MKIATERINIPFLQLNVILSDPKLKYLYFECYLLKFFLKYKACLLDLLEFECSALYLVINKVKLVLRALLERTLSNKLALRVY